ncbi:hypothetical protein ACQP00_33050 [Dactylosporangium sp. CS-047395]|uniref:hypothetical protein n=1 Tax=Dactylosporangium sp. CS-047395 TaxID=3239936 RepID=UPI003D8DEC99
MQVLFIVGGLACIVLGLFGSMVVGDAETEVKWACTPAPQYGREQCDGEANSGGTHMPSQYILAGIGLEIAAAAVAIGGRRDPVVPAAALPAGYPVMQSAPPPYPARPVSGPPPGQPGWPT